MEHCVYEVARFLEVKYGQRMRKTEYKDINNLVRWMCRASLRETKKSDDLCKMLGTTLMLDVIREVG